MKDTKCPRCGGQIPNNQTPGAFPGALSRVADAEVCSACGTDEAMRDYRGQSQVPKSAWPVGGSS